MYQRIITLEKKIFRATAYERTDAVFRGSLLNDFMAFKKYFWPIIFGGPYIIDEPIGREALQLTLNRELLRIYTGEVKRKIIQCPPRLGKTWEVILFICWTMAKHPRSQFIYCSYAKEIATTFTAYMRDVMMLPEYESLFGVRIRKDKKAQDDFMNNFGGRVTAAGVLGRLTGMGAGIRYSMEFAGIAVIDDPSKPEDIFSDTKRNKTIKWHTMTFQSRLNDGIHTPVLLIAQSLHQADLPNQLANGLTGEKFDVTRIPNLDESLNPVCPRVYSKEFLLGLKKHAPYEFYSQHQQQPLPPGGSLYSKDDFILLKEEPKFLFGFMTVDTAETEKEFNDATVFSYWGVHKIKLYGQETESFGLHWILCHECRVIPADLEEEFRMFYSRCLTFEIKVGLVAIEKKNMGTYLCSYLKKMPGITVYPIERGSNSGSKSRRFIGAQPYIKKHLISLPYYGNHTPRCLEHMEGITPNMSHSHDDIADTCTDAIQLALTPGGIVNTMIFQSNVLTIPGYSPFHKVEPISWK
jgi:phage terminase large subunit-like protein